MTLAAKDLRIQTKEVFDAVSRGETVFITYHGKRIAKIVPINDDPCALKNDDEMFGMWRDHEASQDVDCFVRTMRKSRLQKNR